jgi:hypothetical protein
MGGIEEPLYGPRWLEVSVMRSMDEYSRRLGYTDKTILAKRIPLQKEALEKATTPFNADCTPIQPHFSAI